MADPEKPYSFVTLLKLYLRGMLDQQTLNTRLLETLIDLAETQAAHTVLIDLMSEAMSDLDEDIEAQAHYLHLTRPSHEKRAGDDLHPDQNGSTGAADQPPDSGDND